MTRGVCTGKDGAVSRAARDLTAAVESDGVLGVRPGGNKEIMAPRCVCSRMEGGETAAGRETNEHNMLFFMNTTEGQRSAVGCPDNSDLTVNIVRSRSCVRSELDALRRFFPITVY